jgi:drug/metabolite transporter (DMT)-like permease
MELDATVAIAATLFREHLGRNIILAVALVTAAGALLVWDPGASMNLDALFIVGACVCWGVDNSVTSQIDQVSPQHITFLKGTVAGSVNLALGLLITGRARSPADRSSVRWWSADSATAPQSRCGVRGAQ